MAAFPVMPAPAFPMMPAAAFPVMLAAAAKMLPVVTTELIVVIAAEVLPVVTAEILPMIVEEMVPVIAAKVFQVSIPAYRFHYLPEVAIMAFDHNEISADPTVTIREHMAGHRRVIGYGLRQAITPGVDFRGHIIAGHIAEHAANRRPDQGRLSIPADSLADQSPASRSHQQTVDSVMLGLGLHGQ